MPWPLTKNSNKKRQLSAAEKQRPEEATTAQTAHVHLKYALRSRGVA